MYSILLGILVKIFDEINDLEIKIDELYIEIIKAVIIFLFIILGYNDFSFSLSFFVVFLASYLAGGIDTSFWKAVTFILGLLSIYSISPLENLLWRIPSMLIMPVLVYAEAKMYPEEQSLNKIINRIATSAFFGCIFIPRVNNFLESLIGDIQFGEKQVLSVIGYYSVSICVQLYNLYITPHLPKNQIPKQQDSLDEKIDKEMP
jgi:hypothetical protein